jgi:hypothetical protein
VALQRKAVKPDDFAGHSGIHTQMPEIAKESLLRGASGVQTLYMTGSMKIDENDTRKRKPVHRFARGS